MADGVYDISGGITSGNLKGQLVNTDINSALTKAAEFGKFKQDQASKRAVSQLSSEGYLAGTYGDAQEQQQQQMLRNALANNPMADAAAVQNSLSGIEANKLANTAQSITNQVNQQFQGQQAGANLEQTKANTANTEANARAKSIDVAFNEAFTLNNLPDIDKQLANKGSQASIRAAEIYSTLTGSSPDVFNNLTASQKRSTIKQGALASSAHKTLVDNSVSLSNVDIAKANNFNQNVATPISEGSQAASNVQSLTNNYKLLSDLINKPNFDAKDTATFLSIAQSPLVTTFVKTNDPTLFQSIQQIALNIQQGKPLDKSNLQSIAKQFLVQAKQQEQIYKAKKTLALSALNDSGNGASKETVKENTKLFDDYDATLYK